MFGLREVREGDNGRERVTNRLESIQGLKKVTTCNRGGALGHWEDECPQKGHQRLSPGDRFRGRGRFGKQSSSRNRSLEGRQRSEGQV